MVISDRFILNGIEGASKNIALVSFDNEVLINTGIPFSINVNAIDGYSQHNPFFNEEDVVPDDIVLNLMHVKNGVAQEWDKWKILDTKKWLITKDFIPFQTWDNLEYVYYLKCKKIQNKMTPHGMGVLECTFTPLSHFAYKRVNTVTNVTKLSSITVKNTSMYDYKPIVKIKNLGDTSTVNKIGDFEITGLNKDEVVTIDNLMLSVFNQDNVNRFANCNRNWITLYPNENELVVNGNCEIQILCEFPAVL